MPYSHLANLEGGIWQWLIILILVLLLFGSSRLPTLFRSLGSSVNEFKKGMHEGQDSPPPAPKSENPEKKE